MKKICFLLLIIPFFISCAKRDTAKPVAEFIRINDAPLDTITTDTLFNFDFPFETNFKLSDNEGVEQFRHEFIRSQSSQVDLHQLDIKSTGGSKEYEDNVIVDFPSSVLDTLPNDSLGFYKLTLDCFDKSGNQAKQQKFLIEIIIQ